MIYSKIVGAGGSYSGVGGGGVLPPGSPPPPKKKKKKQLQRLLVRTDAQIQFLYYYLLLTDTKIKEDVSFESWEKKKLLLAQFSENLFCCLRSQSCWQNSIITYNKLRPSLSSRIFYEPRLRYIANQSGSARETVNPKIGENIEMLVCFLCIGIHDRILVDISWLSNYDEST